MTVLIQENPAVHRALGNRHEEYLTLGDVWTFVRDNLWVLAVCWAVALGLAVFYLRSEPVQYTAGVKVLIDPEQTRIASVGGATTITLPSVKVDDELEVIRSEAVLLPVITSLALADDPEFESKPSIRQQLFESIRGASAGLAEQVTTDMRVVAANFVRRLDVRRVGQSNVIQISFRSGDPEKAAAIANALADAYFAEELASKSEAARRASRWLETRLTEVRNAATAAARLLDDFKVENQFVEVTAGRFLDEEHLAATHAELVAARSKVMETQARTAVLESALNSGVSLTEIAEDPGEPILRKLREQLLDLASRVRELTSRYGNTAPQTQSVVAEMRALEDELRAQLTRSLEVLRSAHQAAILTEQLLSAELERQRTTILQQGEARVRLDQLASETRAYREMYEALLERYMQSVQRESFPVTDARIVSRATVPLVKSHPSTALTLAVAFTFGSGAAIGFGLLRRLGPRPVCDPQLLEDRTGLPCIGLLPGRKWSRLRRGSHGLISPDYVYALRRMKVALLFALGDRKPVRVGFSAVEHGCGRTTTIVNLARAYSLEDRSVLIINADKGPGEIADVLAKSGVCWQHADQLGDCGPSAGSVTVISTQASRPLSNRITVPMARMKPLLLSPRDHYGGADVRLLQVAAILKEIGTDYDVVLVDLPVLTEAPEIGLIQRYLDGLIIVARLGHTKLEALVKASGNPLAPTPSVAGLVLTGARA